MENAASAVGKLFGKGDSTASTTDSSAPSNTKSTDTKATDTKPTGLDKDTTVDQDVAPAVEHKHVRKEHETQEQTVVDKEKHQDHYKTTVQPLKDSEVRPEKHDYTQVNKERNINHDDKAAAASAEADRSGFSSSTEQKESESKTVNPTKESEHVHHHLHETVQPVIEKEVIDPSVTHKQVNVHEKIQEPSVNHGVETKSAISVNEFKNKLDGESQSTKVDGKAV